MAGFSTFGPGCCCLPYCVTVTDCHGTPLDGAAVTMTAGDPATTVASGSTDADGKFCVLNVNGKSTSISVSKDGFKTGTKVVTPSQGGSTTISLQPDPDEAVFNVWVYMCATQIPTGLGGTTLPNGTFEIGLGPLTVPVQFPLPGITIDFGDGEGTAVTDSSGFATFTKHVMGLGKTITIPDQPPYAGGSVTLNVATCSTYNMSWILAADANHICCGGPDAVFPKVITVSTGGATASATRQGANSNWLACVQPTDNVAADCTGGGCRCPDFEEMGVVVQVDWNCVSDTVTKVFESIHVHVYWHAGTCLVGWTGAVPGAGNPICSGVYYAQCQCPFSLTINNDCTKTCSCPVAGTQPFRGYVWNQLTFDVPASSFSFNPFSVTFDAGTFSLPCTSPGATGTPLDVPPPGGGTFTLSE